MLRIWKFEIFFGIFLDDMSGRMMFLLNLNLYLPPLKQGAGTVTVYGGEE